MDSLVKSSSDSIKWRGISHFFFEIVICGSLGYIVSGVSMHCYPMIWMRLSDKFSKCPFIFFFHTKVH